jgi:spore maturation protein CgeB
VAEPLSFVFLGLSISSSWGNGHATTYRGLVRELARAGHSVTFLERDLEWYRDNRDAPEPEGATLRLYESVDDLRARFLSEVREADVVIVGSYVPDGVIVAEWVLDHARGLRAFYDIDTPVTLRKLARGDFEYLTPGLVPRFDLYLSFTGGPTLDRIEEVLGSPAARHLPCGVDPERYQPVSIERRYDLGYLGTHSEDREEPLERLLLEPARQLADRRFVVGGPSHPDGAWPPNVERIFHVSPPEHPSFYCAQRLTLNITRRDMLQAGYSPSVRLFEAAACGVPVVSDVWDGIDRYFEPGREILLARTSRDVIQMLDSLSDAALREIGARARRRVLASHTAAARVKELLGHIRERKDLHRAAE